MHELVESPSCHTGLMRMCSGALAGRCSIFMPSIPNWVKSIRGPDQLPSVPGQPVSPVASPRRCHFDEYVAASACRNRIRPNSDQYATPEIAEGSGPRGGNLPTHLVPSADRVSLAGNLAHAVRPLKSWTCLDPTAVKTKSDQPTRKRNASENPRTRPRIHQAGQVQPGILP